jgi:di/tricarboxylate transporter
MEREFNENFPPRRRRWPPITGGGDHLSRRLSTANKLGVSLLPFAIAIMMAASASFATPIGYQTNLMVFGAGGYRFQDYLRFGTPLTLLVGLVSVALAPLIWPF